MEKPSSCIPDANLLPYIVAGTVLYQQTEIYQQTEYLSADEIYGSR
jgi:hypothetical protein